MTEAQIDGTALVPEVQCRRNLLKGSLLAAFMALITKTATAAPLNGGQGGAAAEDHRQDSNLRAHGQHNGPQGLLDAFAVSQLLLRERLARETHNYNDEEACSYPDGNVAVSWFKGTAAEFVNSGRRSGPTEYGQKSVYFDSTGPASILVHKDRAIADSACAIHTFLPLGGVEASMTSFTRLLCRVQKANGVWRIAGLRAVYIRDLLEPCNPPKFQRSIWIS